MQVTTGDIQPSRFISRMTLISGLSVLLFSVLVIWLYGYFEKKDLLIDKTQLHQQTLSAFASTPNASLEHWKVHFQNPMYQRLNFYVFITDPLEVNKVLLNTLPDELTSMATPIALTANTEQIVHSQKTLLRTSASIQVAAINHPVSITIISDATSSLNSIYARQVRIALLLLALQSLLIILFWFFARKGDQKLQQSAKEQQAMENELFFLAHYDTITHLPNRTLFWERLDASTSRAARLGKSVVLLLLDLRAFAPLNEQYGRSVGDLVLIEAARRIQAATRTSDLICRIGPDEFAIVLEDMDIDSNSTVYQATHAIFHNLTQQFSTPFLLTEEEHKTIFFSSGAAEFPQDGLSSEDLLAHAQMALNCAKKHSQPFLFFEQTKTFCPQLSSTPTP